MGTLPDVDGLFPAAPLQQAGHLRRGLQHALARGDPLPLRRDQLAGAAGKAPPRVFQPREGGGSHHHDQGAEDELEERLLQVPGHHHQRGPLSGAAHGGGLDPRGPVAGGWLQQRLPIPAARRHPQNLRPLCHWLRGGEGRRAVGLWGSGAGARRSGAEPEPVRVAGAGPRSGVLGQSDVLLPGHRRG